VVSGKIIGKGGSVETDIAAKRVETLCPVYTSSPFLIPTLSLEAIEISIGCLFYRPPSFISFALSFSALLSSFFLSSYLGTINSIEARRRSAKRKTLFLTHFAGDKQNVQEMDETWTKLKRFKKTMKGLKLPRYLRSRRMPSPVGIASCLFSFGWNCLSQSNKYQKTEHAAACSSATIERRNTHSS
jgi:hypothetical protein